jgi:hypothetical protein
MVRHRRRQQQKQQQQRHLASACWHRQQAPARSIKQRKPTSRAYQTIAGPGRRLVELSLGTALAAADRLGVTRWVHCRPDGARAGGGSDVYMYMSARGCHGWHVSSCRRRGCSGAERRSAKAKRWDGNRACRGRDVYRGLPWHCERVGGWIVL